MIKTEILLEWFGIDRRKKMKKSKVGVYLLSSLLVVFLWVLLIMVNQYQLVVENGDILPKDLSRSVRLADWEETEDGYQFVFRVRDPETRYSLLIPHYKSEKTIECNGSNIHGIVKGVNGVYSLPNLEEGQDSYCIFVDSLDVVNFYLAQSEYMSQCLDVQVMCNCALIAIMVIMPIYTISLYLFKSSEKYLWYFYLYQVVFLFWGVIRLFPEFNSTIPWWSRFNIVFVWVTSVMSVKYCMDAAEIQSPDWLVKVFSWKYIPVWAAVIFMIVRENQTLRNVMNMSCYFACALVMANALTRRIKGAQWLFLGAILRTVFSPIIYWSSFRAILPQESFLYFLLNRTYFIELPFLLGGMLFINQKFAHQFTESERLAKHLDELVGERTRELELAHAERQSMILNITHDLRTPLFVMKNCLNMVEENPQSLPDMLPVIQERSNFVSSLTEDLFLLVKLQEGKLMLNQQRVDLAELLEELWVGMTVEAEKRGMRVAHRLIPRQYVWGDRVRLQQIFQNLVSNAFHYTPEGGQVSICMDVTDEAPEGVQIDAECMAVQEQLSWITVTVRDSGKGISPVDAEHIFERYFYTKAENKHDSSGLGLSIAKELTLLHHGTIDFTSEEGRGTEFRVTLPLC